MGYEPGEIEANLDTFKELLHPDDTEATFAALEDHFKNQSSFLVQYRLKTKDGNYRWFLGSGKARFNNEGRPVRMVGSIIDIDNQKRLEEEQAMLIKNMAAKNDQLSEFGHIVSHNIRSPIANLDILLDLYHQSEFADERESIMTKLGHVTQSLHELMDELADTVKIMDGVGVTTEPLKLSDSINRAVNILKGQIESLDAELDVHLEWDDIEYVRLYLDSIVQNLLSNALKYVSPERTPHIEVRSLLVNGKKQLRVKDNGLGINMKRHGENMFGLKKRFHRNIKGKGVGLFLTKNQVNSLEGSIRVESEANVGTEFIIDF